MRGDMVDSSYLAHVAKNTYLNPTSPLSQFIASSIESLRWLRDLANREKNASISLAMTRLERISRPNLRSKEDAEGFSQELFLPALSWLSEKLEQSELPEEAKLRAFEHVSATRTHVEIWVREFSPIHLALQELYSYIYHELTPYLKTGYDVEPLDVMARLQEPRIGYFLRPNEESLTLFLERIQLLLEEYGGLMFFSRELTDDYARTVEEAEKKLNELEAMSLLEDFGSEQGA